MLKIAEPAPVEVKNFENCKNPPLELDIHDPSEKMQDECGVGIVYAPNENATELVKTLNEKNQHRGQDASGLVFNKESRFGIFQEKMKVFKNIGRVATAFEGVNLAKYAKSTRAMGQDLYSTTLTEKEKLALQPFKFRARTGFLKWSQVSIVHNGHFDEGDLADLAQEKKVKAKGSDTYTFTKIIKKSMRKTKDLEDTMHDVFPRLGGAYSLGVMAGKSVYGVRDKHGMRPLNYGINDKGSHIISSEMDGLHATNAVRQGEVEPGTFLRINDEGVHQEKWAEKDTAGCVFELIYNSRETNIINGVRVLNYRKNAGKKLWEKVEASNIEIDPENTVIVPVLGTGKVYARAVAEASGLPVKKALEKNPNSDRTFIEPTQELRKAALRNKFSVNKEMVEGKTLVVVDDSIVRGNTVEQINEMLIEAGAERVIFLVGAAPFKNPCKFGLAVEDRSLLIAYQRSLEQMRELISADALMMLTPEEVIEAAASGEDKWCSGCMDYNYPKGTSPVEPGELDITHDRELVPA